MKFALILLLWFSVPMPKPAPVFADIYAGDHGPYTFMVDTGAQTSVIDAALAAELQLKPQFRVEMVTAHGTHFAPGAKVKNLRLGQRKLPELELIFDDVSVARRLNSSIRGVIGLNALTDFNFQLLPGSGRFEDGAPRAAGTVLPYTLVDGRMVVKARMGEEVLSLVLDSGASHVVLFRTPAAMAKTRPVLNTFHTLDGARSVVPTTWTADMIFSSGLRVGMLPAAIVQRTGTGIEGLLPASVFKKVFVDQGKRELVVVR